VEEEAVVEVAADLVVADAQEMRVAQEVMAVHLRLVLAHGTLLPH
jgi:hypothetical protein